MRKFYRFWSVVTAVCLLTASPVYAEIPVVIPNPAGTVNGGPAAEMPGETEAAGIPGQANLAETPGPTEPGQTGPTGTLGETGPTEAAGTPGQTGPTETTGQTGTADSQDGPGADSSKAAQQPSGTEETPSLEEPIVAAQGAVLMDASTGELLFAKNAETKYYPASITKLMTALLVAERCNLDDIVTFSKTATTNLESGAVTLKLAEGDKLTVRQCMYGLLLKSANEVANGLAEHVSGSISAFADLMNQKAKELGCKNTHFVNPNGLNNSNHYTTPYDMALIGRAAFQNQTVQKVASTLSYQIPATKNAAARTISLGHKMLYPNDSRYYPGVIGGKTGYTSLAGNTLVTCAEKDGVRLIAVIMKSKSTQYTDTKALLDYGFALKKTRTGQEQEPEKAAGGDQTPATGNTPVGDQPPATEQTPNTNQASGWIADGSRWYYNKTDGSRAANEWQTIDGKDYWFDSDGHMAVGWRQFSNNAWYYFHSNGAMASSCWVENGGHWFYLGADGAMLTDTTTPDGYRVDSLGIWVDA